MRRVIRLGDKTTHGGEVVSAADNYSIMGKAVARMGDMATCPRKGHGTCEIVEGDPTWTINGRNVALEGHKLKCGAELISSLGNLSRSYEGDGVASDSGFDLGTTHPRQTIPSESTSKEVLRIFWTYGEAAIPVSSFSRFYSDLNIHVETLNYQAGETVGITIENDEGAEPIQITLRAIVQADGTAKIMNALDNHRIEIFARE